MTCFGHRAGWGRTVCAPRVGLAVFESPSAAEGSDPARRDCGSRAGAAAACSGMFGPGSDGLSCIRAPRASVRSGRRYAVDTRSEPLRKRPSSLRRAKTLARTVLEREPVVGVRILRAARSLQSRWLRRTLRARGGRTFRSAPSTVCDVLCVPPTAIVHSSLTEFGSHDFRGAVIPGDWDISRKEFADLDIFHAMKSVLKDASCAWADTSWYAQTLRRIEAGQTPWNCRTEADLQRRVADLERLYSSIRQCGYRSQAQLAECESNLATGDEVAVAIGRSGELLFCDGAHRLCLALLLGVNEIPVQVSVRHPAWAMFREELLEYARSEGGHLYQPALHPDLAAIPSAHACEERWRLISSRLNGQGGRVLDIGANLGFFDNKLEDLGHHCTAVENDATLAHFMRGIRDANGHQFEIVTDSISSGGSVRGGHFNVVLALNILHHFLKTRHEYGLLERLLDDLECDEMFFEPHGSGEAQMRGAYADMKPEAFTEYVASRSGLTAVEALGEASDGRTVYHLRRRH